MEEITNRGVALKSGEEQQPFNAKLDQLHSDWKQLEDAAKLREVRLDEAEKAHQYYFDADEAIEWLDEQELYMMTSEKAKVLIPRCSL